MPQSLPGNPEGRGDVELVAAAREILDSWHADRQEEDKRIFADRSEQGRTSTDVANLARFATRGAVDTLFVDIDASVLGEVDELGAVTFSARKRAARAMSWTRSPAGPGSPVPGCLPSGTTTCPEEETSRGPLRYAPSA